MWHAVCGKGIPEKLRRMGKIMVVRVRRITVKFIILAIKRIKMMKDSAKCVFKSRRWVWAVAIVCMAVTVGLGCASSYMLDYSLRPVMHHGHNLPWRLNRILTDCPQLRPWADSLLRCHALRDTFVVMPSGERHHATYILAGRPTARVALLVHGYKDNGMGMMHIASIYNRMGYNVLLPDLHAHGRSEGEGVQMGWKDRWDVIRWAEVANGMFGGGGDVQMVLHGVSMGAATVMNVSGEQLPGYVRCFVEDCGYTGVWEEFAYELSGTFGLPEFPLMYTSSVLCKLKYGWTFGEAAPLEQVRKCFRPMLFIHGDKDSYVPFSMMGRLYAAKPQPKAQWVSRGSIHAMSFRDHPAEYAARVSGFVGRYIR